MMKGKKKVRVRTAILTTSDELIAIFRLACSCFVLADRINAIFDEIGLKHCWTILQHDKYYWMNFGLYTLKDYISDKISI